MTDERPSEAGGTGSAGDPEVVTISAEDVAPVEATEAAPVGRVERDRLVAADDLEGLRLTAEKQVAKLDQHDAHRVGIEEGLANAQAEYQAAYEREQELQAIDEAADAAAKAAAEAAEDQAPAETEGV